MNIKVNLENSSVSENQIMEFEKEVQAFSKDLEIRAS